MGSRVQEHGALARGRCAQTAALTTPSGSTEPPEAIWERALSDVVAGRRDAGELIAVAESTTGAEALIATALVHALQIQDWDVVEALIPVCKALPDRRYVGPLSDILDRECLAISNGAVVEVLGLIGAPDAIPALRRALGRKSVPSPHWAASAEGEKEAEDLRSRCASVLVRLERPANAKTGGKKVGEERTTNAC